ncbi:zf-HC2 domain-containing protein, partial [Candidatus Poribacteria bacterium]|nr:zf-HC2 domain-containing protein [Candidatus Poribacteria bacterium]
MECGHVRRRLPQFVDGSLRARRDARIAHHLATCRQCDEQYAGLLGAEDALRSFGDAVRQGDVAVSAPSMPLGDASRGAGVFGWLVTPTPMWAPVASVVAVVALAVVLSAAPDGLSVAWGPTKSGGATDAVSPP